MNTISYKLNNFEGPLDLLVKLIDKKKISISDIKISTLLDQYIEQINLMRDNNIEIKSEFLEMAAKLIYIKTVSLLPNNNEAMELKSELSDTLNAFQSYKEAAKCLTDNFNPNFFTRGTETIEADKTYGKSHKPSELLKVYLNVLLPKPETKPNEDNKIKTIVSKKIVSVFSRVIHILKKLMRLDPFPYKNLFHNKLTKSSAVATFLAVLELVKNKRILLIEKNDELKISLNKEKS